MLHSIGSPTMWAGFSAVVLAVLALDLGVLHRFSKTAGMRGSAIFFAGVLLLAAGFNAAIYYLAGREPALQFLTGYVVEEALSVDNLFVFLLIFDYFKVPSAEQRRVLFWGIFGALAMRAAFIAAGTALVATFHWIFYVFGAFLVFTALKLFFQGDEEAHPEQNFLVRLYQRVVPSTPERHGSSFFVRQNGRLLATPLLLVLVVVEVSDIVFAVDSIPAIFAVTTDPFLVYTSNVFAILGLRSLYFLLAGAMQQFHFLRYGLAIILAFVGGKMLLASFYEVSTGISLAVIFGTLLLTAGASIVFKPRK